jgi:hypothetical protein
MVRPQGLTFRITQPHGLRILYLGTTQGSIVRGETKYYQGVCTSRYKIITLEYATANRSLFSSFVNFRVVCHRYYNDTRGTV